jgi:AcrR family transcriptional regulator
MRESLMATSSLRPRSERFQRGDDLTPAPRRCQTTDMTAVKRQSSELRDEYAALTRQRIVVAFVKALEEDAVDDVSMAALAVRANVAERTIYRHFNSRADLLSAAGEWIEDNVFAYIPFASPDEMPDLFRGLCKTYDRHPKLARAIAVSRVGRSVRAGFRQRVIDQHRKAMAPLTRHLKPKEVRQAAALVSYLGNVLAWNTMREDFGMSSAEVADAIEWALTTLLKDVRRRDAAAAARTPANSHKRLRKASNGKG